jgi:hypothetical protein
MSSSQSWGGELPGKIEGMKGDAGMEVKKKEM